MPHVTQEIFGEMKDIPQERISKVRKVLHAIFFRKVEQGQCGRSVAMLIWVVAPFFQKGDESVFSVVSCWFVNRITCIRVSPSCLVILTHVRRRSTYKCLIN